MTPHSSVTHRSQRVAYPFFLAAALLFLLQVIFGLIIAAQFVWPTFLMNTLSFNWGRASHLNLMVFWLLLGIWDALDAPNAPLTSPKPQPSNAAASDDASSTAAWKTSAPDSSFETSTSTSDAQRGTDQGDSNVFI